MKIFESVADAKAAKNKPGQKIETKGYYTAGDGGAATYLVKTAAEYGGTPDGYGDHYDAAGNVLVLQHNGTVDVKQFGVKGTGYPTDDSLAISAALDYARSTGVQLISQGNMRIYTTSSADMSDVTFVGSGAASMNFGYSADSASYGFDILSNVQGLRPTASVFYGLEDRYKNGTLIYSDVASPVVKINQNTVLKHVGVSGWIGTSGQTGIEHTFSATYEGVSFKLEDVSVTGCGGDGISLQNGIETATLRRVESSQNYGYGLTTFGGGGDDNQEYTVFEHCTFRLNRLDGVRISNFKKNIKFYHCSGNSNGWYGLGASALTKPADQTFIRGLIVIDGVTPSVGQNLVVDSCYSEDAARLVTILADNPIRKVVITNNYLLPVLGLSDTDNHMVYLENTNNGSVYTLVIKQNTHQDGARGAILHGEMASSRILGVDFDQEITYSSAYSATDFYSKAVVPHVFDESVTLNKHLNTGRESIGDGVGGTYTSNFIKDNLSLTGGGNNSHSGGACFLLTSNWQATNANSGGAYLIYATKMPSGIVIGGVIAFSSTTGFTSAPTISPDGTLSVTLDAFYRASITRIDMNGERA